MLVFLYMVTLIMQRTSTESKVPLHLESTGAPLEVPGIIGTKVGLPWDLLGSVRYSYMMTMQVWKVRETIILYLLIVIVWKPSVLHVVLYMLGHCLTNLNIPTQILNFPDTVYPTPDVRPDYIWVVGFFTVLLSMDHGMFGKRQLDS